VQAAERIILIDNPLRRWIQDDIRNDRVDTTYPIRGSKSNNKRFTAREAAAQRNLQSHRLQQQSAFLIGFEAVAFFFNNIGCSGTATRSTDIVKTEPEASTSAQPGLSTDPHPSYRSEDWAAEDDQDRAEAQVTPRSYSW